MSNAACAGGLPSKKDLDSEFLTALKMVKSRAAPSVKLMH